jgi:pyruvate/2-oxoglutarate dehydrogenase complex dihydrolipoamide dehydrogenase (E3) component
MDVNRLAPWMGVEVSRAQPDLTRVRDWKRSLQRSQESWADLLETKGYELVRGEGGLRRPACGARRRDRLLEADRILIATGSRTAEPPIEGLGEVGWIDHVSALELTEVPESLLVLGGGPVGLEFGQMFARFGSRVTIVNGGPRMAARFDPDAADELQQALEAEGIELVHESRVPRVRRDADTIIAELDPSGDEVRAARLLLASGRSINVEELNLDAAGVECSVRAIAVDQHLRTSAEGIWAAGDVTGIQFTPVGPVPRPGSRWTTCSARGAASPTHTTTCRRRSSRIRRSPRWASQRRRPESGGSRSTRSYTHSETSRAPQYIAAEHGLFKVVFEPATRRALGVARCLTRGKRRRFRGSASP